LANVGICDTLTQEYGIRRISKTNNSRLVLFTESNNNTMLLQAPKLGGMDGGDAAYSIANIANMAATGDYVFEVIGYVNLLLC
ncbi:hypothetical protein NAI80_09730, partial [Francisella tularensis subsp. holarctica]|nr:hypothetical protein [Francisella tularensis subsp. holarctica]